MAKAATNAASAPRPEPPLTPEPRRFALTGPSRAIDHQRNAARRDLADIKLAGRWFAPHYALPQSRVCIAGTAICSNMDGEQIATLAAGDHFAVIEIAGGWAWGYRERDDCVGYVSVGALRALAG